MFQLPDVLKARGFQAAWKNHLIELLAFGYHNAVSCIFPVFIFLMLWCSSQIELPYLHRYDFLLVACLLMQGLMLITKLESKDELLVITLFHLIGLGMELFKVNIAGSWAYPEEGWSKLGGVPLYSGFMYASVASFMCQGWRRFELKINNWPHPVLPFLLAVLIYGNFFTNYYMQDIRWVLVPVIFLVFFRTSIDFKNNGPVRQMPLVLAYFLIGFFIFLAENMATYLGAWAYPHQSSGWEPVHYHKLTSWFLMVIVSFIIVAQLKFLKGRKPEQ